MLSFLGLAGYSREWICDSTYKTAPLRALVHTARQVDSSADLQWTEAVEQSFHALKHDLKSAPALVNPDYGKPFFCMLQRCQAMSVQC